MVHTYLTETMIKDALEARAITENEAEELVRTLECCREQKECARMAS